MSTKPKRPKPKAAAAAANPPVQSQPGEPSGQAETVAESPAAFDPGGCLRKNLIALKAEFDAFKANVTAQLVKLTQKSL